MVHILYNLIGQQSNSAILIYCIRWWRNNHTVTEDKYQRELCCREIGSSVIWAIYSHPIR